MEILLILLLLIVFLPLMSIGGWIYKGIDFLMELFFDGLDGCFSGCLNIVMWAFLIALLLMMI